jgi:hypothetical protein
LYSREARTATLLAAKRFSINVFLAKPAAKESSRELLIREIEATGGYWA